MPLNRRFEQSSETGPVENQLDQYVTQVHKLHSLSLRIMANLFLYGSAGSRCSIRREYSPLIKSNSLGITPGLLASSV